MSHSTPKYSEDKEWNNDRGANFDGVIQIFFFFFYILKSDMGIDFFIISQPQPMQRDINSPML